jgi:hypothetical protein
MKNKKKIKIKKIPKMKYSDKPPQSQIQSLNESFIFDEGIIPKFNTIRKKK